jgi:uncharacterized phage protein (TIGR01671 family)
MREIKFRAWNKTDKTMGEPFTLQSAIGSRSIMGVDTSEVEYMQYTGLKDINDKEIYEGDIVAVTTNPDGSDHALDIVAYYASETYPYPAFDLDKWEGESNGLSYWLTEGTVEVVGNIYENPTGLVLLNNEHTTER